MKKVTVTLDPATRKQLKRLAVETDTTVESLVPEAIAASLAKRQGSWSPARQRVATARR